MGDPLAPCVHCGFCLPACPTYLATGDESDSPRGRIVLMRALERGDIGVDDPALVQHLEACLGCRGCEPVCPSGVAYGRGLEVARGRLAERRGLSPVARLVLGVFRYPRLWRPLFTAARVARELRLPQWVRGGGRLGFGMAMLHATRGAGVAPSKRADGRSAGHDRAAGLPRPNARFEDATPAPRVALFRGCVMDTLFRHVHEATKRTLEVNGYRVVEVEGQGCCGALHEHAGDQNAARGLARRNVEAFDRDIDYIAVNSAGCGALLKDYGHLIDSDVTRSFAGRVRDVTELLAAAGPRKGAPLDLDVAYDAPCHLQHAQRIQDPPLAVLRAVPGLRVRLLADSDRCCGGAGIYSFLQPVMSRAVLDAKIATFAAADPRPDIVATGNPGCLMQIGGGLRVAGLPIRTAHPVEILDWSYRRAGYYSVSNRVESDADVLANTKRP